MLHQAEHFPKSLSANLACILGFCLGHLDGHGSVIDFHSSLFLSQISFDFCLGGGFVFLSLCDLIISKEH